MPTNENGEVSSTHIEDELPLIAVILIYGDLRFTEVREERLDISYRYVGNSVDFLIG
ncbi:hypothetical protein IV77_GL001487 [Olsenella uli DSM 7084]|nr:hypothetical protein HMPREF1503_0339 [Olsenella uli MSTE5]KRO12355.1 hypothetical protein IV77_GL001487 [Olsenella uli DSM 7084]